MHMYKILFLLLLLNCSLFLFAENETESLIMENTTANTDPIQNSSTLEQTDAPSSVAKIFIVVGLLGLIFIAIFNWQKSSKSKD